LLYFWNVNSQLLEFMARFGEWHQVAGAELRRKDWPR
jgi:hypothetical protein